ncbi:MAG: DUF418 domain-containing protein [Planctomycetota bacterium]
MSDSQATAAWRATGDSAPDGSRLLGFDLARGLAFLGMVIVNFKVVLLWNSDGDPEWLQNLLGQFSSRAAPLFVLLAGAGMTMLHRSGERRMENSESSPPWNRRFWLRRSLFLVFLIGATFLIAHTVRRQGETPILIFDQLLVALGHGDLEPLRDYFGRLKDSARAFLGGENWPIFAVLALTLGALITTWGVKGKHLGPRMVLVHRALFVLVFGYAWYPIWEGDILHYYGVYLLLGTVLVGRSAFWCWLVLAAILIGTPIAQLNFDVSAGWSMFLSYGEFWERDGALRNLTLNGWHPLLPWFGLLVTGLLVGRLDATKRLTGLLLLGVGTLLWGSFFFYGDAMEDGLREHARSQLTSAVVEELPAAEASAGGGSLLIPSVSDSVDPTTRGLETFEEDRQELQAISRRLNRRSFRSDYSFDEWTMQIVEADANGVVASLEVRGGDSTEVERLDELFGLAMSPKDERFDVMPVERWSEWPKRVQAIRIVHRPAEGETPSLHHEITFERANSINRDDHAVAWVLRENSFPAGIIWLLSAIGTSLMVLGSCLLITQFRATHRFVTPLVRTGQMALTLYVLHVVFGLELVKALGFDEDLDLPKIATIIVVMWIVSIAFASGWKAIFRRGPLENVMRFLAG